MRKVTLTNAEGKTITVFPIDAPGWKSRGYSVGGSAPIADTVEAIDPAEMTKAQIIKYIEKSGMKIPGYKTMNRADLLSALSIG